MATRRTTGTVRTTEAAPAPPADKVTPRRNEPVKTAAESGASTRITVSADARRAMIEQAAYLRAERRGFSGGDEVADWLAAEAEVDALLRAGHGRQPQ